ncbi:MAG: hypothetical protein V4734_07700, partial [Terriglobus sp.]
THAYSSVPQTTSQPTPQPTLQFTADLTLQPIVPPAPAVVRTHCPDCHKPIAERGMVWKDGLADLCANQIHGPLLHLVDGVAMYRLEYTKAGTLKHSQHCTAAFGRYDWACARCCELQAGALPRKSKHREYLLRKLNEVQRRLPLTA